jgi:cytochrome c biogenesis factor
VSPESISSAIQSAIELLGVIGRPLQLVLMVVALALAACAVVPSLRRYLDVALRLMVATLVLGEIALIWFHWTLYANTPVANPTTGAYAGTVAVPLWVESEKLYVWALIVGVMALFMKRDREDLLPGVSIAVAALTMGAVLWGRPFTEPLPQFLEQYLGYLGAMTSGNAQAAFGAYQGMESARIFYYNTWYMWVHPPMLFFAYGTFVISYVATVQMVRTRWSGYEETAYRWARLGYLPLTAGMLIGFPWAILAWQGESWWWSGKVNMSIMMWLLYTAYLHARLYLRRRGMWKVVAALAILSFTVLVLTYLATYVVPGAHSYV